MSTRAHLRGAAASFAVAVVWGVLAAWRPTVTYHLAPALVAAAWPWLIRDRAVPAGTRDAGVATAGAVAVAVVTSLVLLAVGWMRGPTLWGSGHAMVEVVPAVAAGAWFGFRRARCGPPL